MSEDHRRLVAEIAAAAVTSMDRRAVALDLVAFDAAEAETAPVRADGQRDTHMRDLSMRAALREGASMADIAKAAGISRQRAHQILTAS